MLFAPATAAATVNGTPCNDACSVQVLHDDPVAMVIAPGTDASTTPHLPFSFEGFAGGPCDGSTALSCNFTASADVTATATIVPYNRMFVTPTSPYAPGAFATVPGANGASGPTGFDGADRICQAAAVAAGLSTGLQPRTFKAYLASSSPAVNAFSRLFNAAREKQPRGWVRVDGVPFADKLVESSGFDHPLARPNLRADGVAYNGAVVSGCSGNGTPEPGTSHCSQWSDVAAPNAMGGLSYNGSQYWTRSSLVACNNTSAHIYCFGTDFAAPLTLPAPTGPVRMAFASDSVFTPGPSGILGADSLCRNDAVTLGLCADATSNCPYQAFLADIILPANTGGRNWGDATLPVYRPDHVRVAASFTALLNGIIDVGIDWGPNLRSGGGYFRFTGADNPTTGGTSGTTCNGWTNTAGNITWSRASRFGSSSPSFEYFFEATTAVCSGQRIYCLERL
jgi:hypothetical protein